MEERVSTKDLLVTTYADVRKDITAKTVKMLECVYQTHVKMAAHVVRAITLTFVSAQIVLKDIPAQRTNVLDAMSMRIVKMEGAFVMVVSMVGGPEGIAFGLERLIQGFVSPILANTVDLVLKSLTAIDVSVLPVIKAETANFLLALPLLLQEHRTLALENLV